jgi:flagellar basal body rod protein FlgG
MWVAVGGGTTHTIAYSNNGTTWTGLGKTIITDRALGVAWNGTMWVAVGEGTNSIAYSNNGTTWTRITLKSIFSSNGRGVASNAGNRSVTSYIGNVSITGPGIINTYVTQTAASGYTALTTPTLAGTINVLSVPTIRQAATQRIVFL